MLSKAQAIADYLVTTRREIHRHPELGFQEVKTAALVCNHLEKLGLPYRSGMAGTGVLADLKSTEGPTVLLRADMDALPIIEATGLPFSSEVPGVMHACGHDAHTAMLLGAAHLLAREEFPGTVRLLFQPSEENNDHDPEGYSGAPRMIREGALEGVSAAVGLHQIPMLPTGTISLRSGPVLAAADRFEIVVNGRAAHAGVNPEAGVDAVMIAAQLVTLLQSVVSRNVSPTDPAVVSIGTIQGGSSYNVVADRVTLTGTTRALNDLTYNHTLERIGSICDQLGRMHGTNIEFHVRHAVPVTSNDERVTEVATAAARKVFGARGVLSVPPAMGAEDFAFYGQKVPACFALLGTQAPGSEPSSLHHPQMILDEQALPLGSAWLAQTALDLLQSLQA